MSIIVLSMNICSAQIVQVTEKDVHTFFSELANAIGNRERIIIYPLGKTITSEQNPYIAYPAAISCDNEYIALMLMANRANIVSSVIIGCSVSPGHNMERTSGGLVLCERLIIDHIGINQNEYSGILAQLSANHNRASYWCDSIKRRTIIENNFDVEREMYYVIISGSDI